MNEKDIERAKIAADMVRYLAAGGKVESVDSSHNKSAGTFKTDRRGVPVFTGNNGHKFNTRRSK
jgi:hypothetical protein